MSESNAFTVRKRGNRCEVVAPNGAVVDEGTLAATENLAKSAAHLNYVWQAAGVEALVEACQALVAIHDGRVMTDWERWCRVDAACKLAKEALDKVVEVAKATGKES